LSALHRRTIGTKPSARGFGLLRSFGMLLAGVAVLAIPSAAGLLPADGSRPQPGAMGAALDLSVVGLVLMVAGWQSVRQCKAWLPDLLKIAAGAVIGVWLYLDLVVATTPWWAVLIIFLFRCGWSRAGWLVSGG
jgi:hypothetical protein